MWVGRSSAPVRGRSSSGRTTAASGMGRPHLPRPHHQPRRPRPARRPDHADRVARRPPRADRLPLDRRGPDLERGRAAAALPEGCRESRRSWPSCGRTRSWPSRRSGRSRTSSGSRPATPSEPGVWYAGGSPQGLFRTEDGGDTWAAGRRASTTTRSGRTGGPSGPKDGTPDGAKLHSVIVDPRDASAPVHRPVGRRRASRALDGGATGRRSTGLARPTFLPDPDAEFGHDPHCVRLHPLRPDRLYQQNHCGIYRLDRPGDRLGAHRRRHAAARSATSASRSSCTRATPTPRGCSRWTAPTSGRARAPTGARRVYRHARRRRDVAAAATTACPSAGVVHGQAPGDDGRRAPTRSASTSARPAASSGSSATRARAGGRIAAHLPEIYSVEAAELG